jgi:hypothetical protein
MQKNWLLRHLYALPTPTRYHITATIMIMRISYQVRAKCWIDAVHGHKIPSVNCSGMFSNPPMKASVVIPPLRTADWREEPYPIVRPRSYQSLFQVLPPYRHGYFSGKLTSTATTNLLTYLFTELRKRRHSLKT